MEIFGCTSWSCWVLPSWISFTSFTCNSNARSSLPPCHWLCHHLCFCLLLPWAGDVSAKGSKALGQSGPLVRWAANNLSCLPSSLQSCATAFMSLTAALFLHMQTLLLAAGFSILGWVFFPIIRVYAKYFLICHSVSIQPEQSLGHCLRLE